MIKWRSDAASNYVKAEVAKWAQIMKTAGVTAE
jgi:hypothetical protein